MEAWEWGFKLEGNLCRGGWGGERMWSEKKSQVERGTWGRKAEGCGVVVGGMNGSFFESCGVSKIGAVIGAHGARKRNMEFSSEGRQCHARVEQSRVLLRCGGDVALRCAPHAIKNVMQV